MSRSLRDIEVKAAILDFCRDNPDNGKRPSPNGNPAIAAMLLLRFQMVVNRNQVASIVNELGIRRRRSIILAAEENRAFRPWWPALLNPTARENEEDKSRRQTRGYALKGPPPKPTTVTYVPRPDPLAAKLKAIIAKPATTLTVAKSSVIARGATGFISPFDNFTPRPVVRIESPKPDLETKRKLVCSAAPTGPSKTPCQWPVRVGSVIRPWVLCGVDRVSWPYCSEHLRASRTSTKEAA